MSWSDVNISEEKWKEILSQTKLNSYKNLNTGYSYSHKKIRNIKLIYKIDQKKYYLVLLLNIIKYITLVIINIDGGIEGLVNKSIINSLILFFKKKYKFF